MITTLTTPQKSFKKRLPYNVPVRSLFLRFQQGSKAHLQSRPSMWNPHLLQLNPIVGQLNLDGTTALFLAVLKIESAF
jgi:hypothetical protein